MIEYAAIALALVVGAAIGALIRDALIEKPSKARPLSRATEMRQIIEAMELERRNPPEPPTMAELAREEAKLQIDLYCADKLPDLLVSALVEVKKAKANGEFSCTLSHGLGMSRKERALQGMMASELEASGFKVFMHRPWLFEKYAGVEEGETLICW